MLDQFQDLTHPSMRYLEKTGALETLMNAKYDIASLHGSIFFIF